MHNRLTPEQIRTCRENPLAAYLAKRLPFMLGMVLALSVVCLFLLGYSTVVSIENEVGELNPGANRITISVIAAMTLLAIVLAFELNWMTKHKIFPETLIASEMTFEEEVLLPDLEDPLPMPAVSPPRDGTHGWRQMVEQARWAAAANREAHRHSSNPIEKDFHRSLEVHWATLADMIEAGYLCLEDKLAEGKRGTGTGRKQIELTRENFQRIGRIAQQGTRKLWPKGQKKPLAKR